MAKMKSIKVKMRYHNLRIMNDKLNEIVTYKIDGALISGIWVALVDDVKSNIYHNLRKEHLLNENYKKKKVLEKSIR